MKKSVILYSLCLVILVIILHSCKKQEVPTVTTSAITNITGTAASSGGTVIDEGTEMVLERGVCWSTGEPSILDSKTTDGMGTGSFASNLSNLNPATMYWVRAYATNSVGTGYGMAISFTTLGQAPTATTEQVTNVTTTSATLNGVINANYLSTIVTFEYGLTMSYGQTVTAIQSPVTGNTPTNVSANLSGLPVGTMYHYRVKAVNSLGTTYGNNLPFGTLGQAPDVLTQSACCPSITGAKLNGTVNANYLSTDVSFEYGITTSYGSTVIASQSPVTGNHKTNVSANISGLNAGTTYHFRVKGINSLGTTYGEDLLFTTIMADVDGNVYRTLTIGTQVWMTENLQTTKLNNGVEIPLVEEISTWEILATPGYCWYNNDILNKATCGALYNWYTLETGKLCPNGWHVPSDEEWDTFKNYLFINGYGFEGNGDDVAKSIASQSAWRYSPIPGSPGNAELANNSSGFNGFPAGYRAIPNFFHRGENAAWWSSTGELSIYSLYFDGLYFSHVTPQPGTGYSVPGVGHSVRCLKD